MRIKYDNIICIKYVLKYDFLYTTLSVNNQRDNVCYELIDCDILELSLNKRNQKGDILMED